VFSDGCAAVLRAVLVYVNPNDALGYPRTQVQHTALAIEHSLNYQFRPRRNFIRCRVNTVVPKVPA
jgi:hypothetical protein